MIRRPPRSTPKPSSAASDVYKRQIMEFAKKFMTEKAEKLNGKAAMLGMFALIGACLLYTSPSPRD